MDSYSEHILRLGTTTVLRSKVESSSSSPLWKIGNVRRKSNVTNFELYSINGCTWRFGRVVGTETVITNKAFLGGTKT